MPFEIVRNDIVHMQVDAIVNAANHRPVVGYGVDAGIHKTAGPELLEARKTIGEIHVGQAAVTPAFGLNAKVVIHAVGPIWQGGGHREEELLRACYENALRLALDNGCKSIAFPLLSAGNYGYPKDRALQVAVGVFSRFLMAHDMQIYLVVFERDALLLSEKLFHSVASYIDETYIRKKELDEYGLDDRRGTRWTERIRREMARYQTSRRIDERDAFPEQAVCAPMPPVSRPLDLNDLLDETDAGFSETLLRLIDRTGKKDSVIYKKANVDRKHFSKIRNNMDYRPTKATALAFAIALELSLDETRDLIGRAGYALTHSSKFDIIVEYFIRERNYDVFELNKVLFQFDQPSIGG